MKFMGSKSRIAKHICPIIQKEINKNNIKHYGEFFVGGANVIDKIKCENRYGSDLNPYLIALLKEVQNGNQLLSEVPRSLYNSAREAYHKNDLSHFKEWEIGCIGFLASYNGRFFDGGYAVPDGFIWGRAERNLYIFVIINQSSNGKVCRASKSDFHFTIVKDSQFFVFNTRFPKRADYSNLDSLLLNQVG